MPPKYLPTGEQTQNALKAVRFPTHVSFEEKREARWKREESKGPVMKAVEENARRAREEEITGVSNTSPQDPNQA